MTFDEWYTCYPRKLAVQAARKAWNKLKPDDELAKKMTLALDAQKRYARESGQELKFWPYPATWINGHRWEDFIPSHAELKEKAARAKCATHDCQGDAMRNCTRCVECSQLDAHKQYREQLLRTHFAKLNIQKGQDWKTPCLQAMYRINPYMARLIGRG